MGNKCSLKGKNIEKYLIKVDEIQIDRMQQMHHILKSCCQDTNYSSPISKDLARGIQVLDIGSGPGTWVFDMSSDYPKSKFTGIEIKSSMLPTVRPFNTRFIYHNVLDGLPFPPNSFDYIHIRSMLLCFTELQYEKVIKESIEVLKPNGYLELCEPCVSSHHLAPIGRRIFNSVEKLLQRKSMNILIGNRLHEFMLKHNLRHIEQEEVMLPLSPLNGKIGKLLGQCAYHALFGMKDMLAKQMKLTDSEIIQLFDDFLEETKIFQMYYKYKRIYGKKLFLGK